MRHKIVPVFAVSGSLLLGAPVSAEIPETLLTSPLAETFGAPAAIGRPRLSPDGSKMLFLTQDPEGIGLAFVLEFESGELTTVGIGSEEGYDLGWCEWASNERIVCDMIFLMDADGGNLAQIQRGRLRRPPERSGTCGLSTGIGATDLTLDRMPEDPNHIARTCGSSSQVDLQSGLIETIGVGSGADLRGSLMSDGRNFTRLQRHRDVQAAFDRWYFRDAVGADWVLLHDANPVDFDDPFRPVGFGESPDALFNFAVEDGRWALYGVDLGGDPVNQLLWGHPLFDLELVDTMGAYGRVVAVPYLDGRPQRFVVDERLAEVYQAASELFPNQNVEVVDESWDGNSYLLLAREAPFAGNYYRLDMWEGTVEALGPEHPALAGVELTETRTVSFGAADGGTITGHLTLPADGVGHGGAVVIPRAAPSRLDVADPHYLVQFLAANGYAVLRLNTRATEEYGAWLPERTVLGYEQGAGDVNEAIDFLVAEGITEPGRVCGLGRDLGAYTALTNAILHPRRLACVVSIGGTSDSRAIVGSQILATLAGDYNDMLRDSSPIRRADDIEVPVLLFHGAYDGVVPMFTHTLELHRALDRADKDVTFIEYEYARHAIERGPYRIDMLTRIAQFLERHTGS